MRQATIKRVEKIYEILGRGGYWSTQELTDALGWPKGTLSPFISKLTRTKHVISHNGKHRLPDFPKEISFVANDIIKERKKYTQNRLRKSTVHTFPKNPEPLNLFKGEEFETIQVQIQKAIALLKSNGYKILAKKIEYTEI